MGDRGLQTNSPVAAHRLANHVAQLPSLFESRPFSHLLVGEFPTPIGFLIGRRAPSTRVQVCDGRGGLSWRC